MILIGSRCISLQTSHDRDLHAVDRRKRIEQAVPFLAAVAAHPELTGRGPELKRRRLEIVKVHSIAEHGEETFLLRQSLGQPPPRVAAVLAPPDRRSAAGTRSCRRLERHDVDHIGIVRMDDDGKSEVGRQSLRDGSPRVTMIVASQNADVRPRSARSRLFGPSAVILHIEQPRNVLVSGDLVDALTELGIRIG
jgi:hypothetical protein